MRKLLVAIVIVAAASGCGYDGKYRYECQDPENWENPECNPPACLVDNMCTETLLGFDPLETNEITDTTIAEVVTP